jgi:hypothetical protein
VTNYVERFFQGTTQQNLLDSTSALNAANFIAATSLYNNTNDATVPYAPLALATIVTGTFAANPVEGSEMELWGVIQDTITTSDDTGAPSGSTLNAPRHFGSWTMQAATTPQTKTIVIDVNGLTSIQFYIKNGTAQNLTNSTNHIKLYVTPLARGIVA